MRAVLTIAFSVLFSAAAGAAGKEKTVIIPAGMDRAYDEFHYAPAIRVGDMVIVSGIPAARGATYEEKIRGMFEHLKTTLADAGASLDDVVEITTFHRDVTDTPTFRQEFERFRTVQDMYFKQGYPAWTAVGTTALLAEGAPVEMRAMAMLGAGKRLRVQRAAKP